VYKILYHLPFTPHRLLLLLHHQPVEEEEEEEEEAPKKVDQEMVEHL
jgi:hypothetical protein